MTWDVSAFSYDFTVISTVVGVLLGAMVVKKNWHLIKSFIGAGRV
jgi:hypothetical protein